MTHARKFHLFVCGEDGAGRDRLRCHRGRGAPRRRHRCACVREALVCALLCEPGVLTQAPPLPNLTQPHTTAVVLKLFVFKADKRKGVPPRGSLRERQDPSLLAGAERVEAGEGGRVRQGACRSLRAHVLTSTHFSEQLCHKTYKETFTSMEANVGDSPAG